MGLIRDNLSLLLPRLALNEVHFSPHLLDPLLYFVTSKGKSGSMVRIPDRV
jgi:hypothetical protein